MHAHTYLCSHGRSHGALTHACTQGGASADSVVFVRAAAVAGNVEVVGHLVRLKLGELAGWVRGGYGVQRCGDEKI